MSFTFKIIKAVLGERYKVTFYMTFLEKGFLCSLFIFTFELHFLSFNHSGHEFLSIVFKAFLKVQTTNSPVLLDLDFALALIRARVSL